MAQTWSLSGSPNCLQYWLFGTLLSGQPALPAAGLTEGLVGVSSASKLRLSLALEGCPYSSEAGSFQAPGRKTGKDSVLEFTFFLLGWRWKAFLVFTAAATLVPWAPPGLLSGS